MLSRHMLPHLFYMCPLLLAELAEVRLESAAILVQDGATLLQLLLVTCIHDIQVIYDVPVFTLKINKKVRAS